MPIFFKFNQTLEENIQRECLNSRELNKDTQSNSISKITYLKIKLTKTIILTTKKINPIQQFLESHKHYNDFLKDNKEGQKTKQDIYQEIQMYKSLMKLISTLSENNQLGIIQCQRTMIYEDMKLFLLSPQTPFVIKKETFKVFFQIYIQQTEESNSNFSIVEMNEILYNVILKDLQQFSKYIEGLVSSEYQPVEAAQQLQMRIKDYTKEFFEEKTQNMDKTFQQNYAKSANQKEDNSVDIIDSYQEYWDYLYSGYSWNLTKDGLLQIILDCYSEINKRKWLEFETSESEKPSIDQEFLTDYLLLVKLICSNIRGIIRKIENKFDINLSELSYILSECIIQNTVKKEFDDLKNTKQGQLNIVGLQQKLHDSFVEDLEAYVKSVDEQKLQSLNQNILKHKNISYRLKELESKPKEPPKEYMHQNEKYNSGQVPRNLIQIKEKYTNSIKEQKNSILACFIFFEKIRSLIYHKYLTIHQIYKKFDTFFDPLQTLTASQKNFENLFINKESFMIKFISLLKKVGVYGLADSNSIGYDDIKFFYDAFLIVYYKQNNLLKKNGNSNTGIQLQMNNQVIQNTEMNKLLFLDKLSKYIEKNTQREEVQNELILMKPFEKSYQQFEYFKYYTHILKQISLEFGQEIPFQSYASNIINELLQCSDSDQRRKIKVFFEQIVNLLKKKNNNYFSILNNFIEELAAAQNQSVPLVQNQLTPQANIIQPLDQFHTTQKTAREIKKIHHPQKYLRISQNLIWNQKLYYQILVTISEIYSDTQSLSLLNKTQQSSSDQNNFSLDNSNTSLNQQVKALINRKKENKRIVLNCMKIVNGLYSLNLKHSHAQLISILKKSSNIKITRNFLSFIKQSFTNYLQAIENLSYHDPCQYILYKEKKEELQLQEEIVLQVLKVIENSCELCNEEFQNFFRVQNIVSSQSYVPLNILSEILYFLTNFTRFKHSYFSTFTNKQQNGYQQDDSGQNLRYYLVINQCIATLKNLCNGTSPKNKDVLLNNSHFLIQLNHIITESDLDLQSENLKDIRILQTISNCIDLLLTIVVCSNNQNSLLRLISIMNMEKIIKLLNFIYHSKIKSRLEIIQQEQTCNHQNQFTCSTSVCYKKYITYHDQLIMRLAFNIVIVIELILDTVNEEELNIKMRMQEENTLLLSIFLEMKKNDDFTDYSKSTNEKSQDQNSMENKQLLQRKSTTDRQSKIFDSKKSKIFRNSRSFKKLTTSKKSTTIQNVLYNEIREDESSKQDEVEHFYQDQLAQEMGFQKDIHPPNKINQMKKERFYLKESLSFYLQFVGSVEIVKDKQLSKLFFRIPLLSSYLTHNIRKNLINKAVYFSDKNEMRFCQNLSKHQLIIYAVEYRSQLSTLIFVLIIIINLLFLFKLTVNKSGESEFLDPDPDDTVFLAIKLIHLIFTFMNLTIVTIERYPVVAYQKYIELKQTYRNKFSQSILRHELIAFIFDFDFIYYLIYLILTLSALNNIIIYSVLLIDVIKLSDDLRQLILVFSLNFRKLFKTAILCLLIVFIYALIGAKVFTSHYIDSDATGNITSTNAQNFYSYFSATLMDGLLNPQGINQALVIPGIYNNRYWGRFFYDISFWLLVNFLFLNMMLGQIIDSYSEFRNLLRQYEKNIKRKCFICGLTVEDLEGKTLDWDNHIKYEHNLNNYLNYIIYIKSKPIDECDGIEKYVKECISKEQTDFFPQRNTLAIERLENKKL